MSTSAERQRRYRARAMARGYRRVMFFASPATQTALDAWRANGQTTDEIIRIALESLSENASTTNGVPAAERVIG